MPLRGRASFTALLAGACALATAAAASSSSRPARPASSAGSASESEFVRDWEKWHRDRIERLKSESGWLTLVGLDWLKPGANSFGADPSSAIPLPTGRAPARAGVLTLDGETVRVTADPGAGVVLNDGPLAPGVPRDLKTDATGAPDVLKIGTLSFHVIRRGERLGVRVKDPESPVRRDFEGIDSFPPSSRWRVEADFVAAPKDVEIATVLGTTEIMKCPGFVKFRVEGQDVMLEPVIEDPNEPALFFIFRDKTSGKETYGSGRFLDADMPKDGKVVLDFNRATNPPCAFTSFATCPLAPKANWLPVRIEAGEKAWHGKGAPQH